MTVTAVVVAVLVAVPLMLALQLGGAGPQPHRLALGVSGPALVAQEIAERSDALPGRPFDAVALPEGTAPADRVRDGLLSAAVTIDFGADRDVLHVRSTTDPALVAAVRVRLEAVSSTYGRTLRVVEVPPARSAEAWRGTPYALVVAWVLLGVAVSVGLSWTRGPVARDGREAAVRLGVCGTAALLGGLLLAAVVAPSTDVRLVSTTVLGASSIAATTWVVLGAESLLGLGGLAVAVPLVLGSLAPVLTLTDPAALPWPWPDVVPWTPAGAALDLAENEVFAGLATGARPWAVLGTWALGALLVLVVARRAREEESA